MLQTAKSRQPPLSAPTVQFGRYLSVLPHEGYVIEHCRKSSSQSVQLPADIRKLLGEGDPDPHAGTPAARMAHVEHKDTVFTQLKSAMDGIKSVDRSLPSDKDPYQDPNETVRKLAFEVSRNRNSLYERVDCLVDAVRPFVSTEDEARHPRLPENDSQYKFELDRTFVFAADFNFLPDRVHYAGDILAQPEREVVELGSGARTRKLVHDLESVLLAAAVMRQFGDTEGYAVYPSLAICRNPSSADSSALAYVPLVSLVNMDADIPFKTFTLLRQHPEMGSVTILSDTAMAGTLHLVLAEMRMKRLCIEMAKRCTESYTLLPDLVPRLDTIADALFEYHKAWPYGSLLTMTMEFMYDVTQVSFSSINPIISQIIAGRLQADALFGYNAQVSSYPCADQIAWYLMNNITSRFDKLGADVSH